MGCYQEQTFVNQQWIYACNDLPDDVLVDDGRSWCRLGTRRRREDLAAAVRRRWTLLRLQSVGVVGVRRVGVKGPRLASADDLWRMAGSERFDLLLGAEFGLDGRERSVVGVRVLVEERLGVHVEAERAPLHSWLVLVKLFLQIKDGGNNMKILPNNKYLQQQAIHY